MCKWDHIKYSIFQEMKYNMQAIEELVAECKSLSDSQDTTVLY